MKITKKHFIEQVTANKTIFLGIARKSLTDDEVLTALNDFLKSDKANCEQRTATAKSNRLLFSNGSSLYFDNVAERKEYAQINNILSFTEVYEDGAVKTLYYYIV